ncbi:xanthine dehydrogenase accessory protein XdhC [Rugamonas sp.]|uniref:xanthine dehydrogenase accessory protein XdhC n=1 Tax=Rugamonas sp. TaxID=1926287 RepID=UPI0025F48D11|nr:xanthine dehydrogenase accessory protein XdhC [Rugamonas sp.]
MKDWLTVAESSEPSVLVTVAMVEGSGPREPGAKMLVMRGVQFDTIGGGHLEMQACEIARAMLGADGRATQSQARAQTQLQRFALGPGLGQCCGGVVYLVFEYVDAHLLAVLDSLRQRRQQDSWRLSAIDGPSMTALSDADGRTLSGAAIDTPDYQADRRTRVIRDPQGRRWLLDPCLAPRAHLLLFGAGHVGAAIVRALAGLPCTVTWIDERDAMFPSPIPDNVTVEASDTPEALVDAARPGSSYLVMTHSHALDQRLSEAILARDRVGWFGLIGSKTKRAQFEHRLHARGLPAERIAAMVCPVGVAGISGKQPAVIAAAVCAQLLMVWEAQQAAAASPLRLVASASA